jgi:hypothetical protein
MRVAADEALDDLACLAQVFAGSVTVPGFDCTHVLVTWCCSQSFLSPVLI